MQTVLFDIENKKQSLIIGFPANLERLMPEDIGHLLLTVELEKVHIPMIVYTGNIANQCAPLIFDENSYQTNMRVNELLFPGREIMLYATEEGIISLEIVYSNEKRFTIDLDRNQFLETICAYYYHSEQLRQKLLTQKSKATR